MQHATTMFGVPFAKDPRIGQTAVFKKVAEESPTRLNIKLPTGYGKTITALGSYAILRNQGVVNRVLVIVPTTAQLDQLKNDGPSDLQSVGITEQISITDIGYFGTKALKKSSNNEAHVFTITVQALSQPVGQALVAELMSKCRWLVVVDEYHHYGIDAIWGRAVLALQYERLIAMSATPFRKADDSAFGEPDITVTYRDAMNERAVKPLSGHSYNYRVDAVLQNGEVVTFTTDEIADAAGGDTPEKIEQFKASRSMRWSPKYVSPLVSIPLERMLSDRVATGFRLQAIVGAMCVSHAQMVAKQVSEMFPELSVDWVGTGPDGRSDADNDAIIRKFCPPKDHNGKRTPALDVLVHVGKAGEGLDSVLVSEVIHLNKASWNNSNDQENGRAARYLDGVVGNINFDSSSEYAVKGYVGNAIMDAMDAVPPTEAEDDDGEKNTDNKDDVPELPDEPKIQIWDISLESINSGELKKMAPVLQQAGVTGIDYSQLRDDMESPEWKKIEDLYRGMRHLEAARHNEEATIRQWRESVTAALGVVTSRTIRNLSVSGMRTEKSFAGDVKKRINRMKKIRCGEITEDIEVCKRHYAWLKALEREIIENGVPSWLQ